MPNYDVITFTNSKGDSIDFSNDPYMSRSYDGFGIGEFELTTVAPPGAHGEYWYDTRMGAKVVTVEIQFIGDGVNEKQASRRELVRILNPLLGPGTLRIDQVNGVTRELRCILSESLGLSGADMIGVGSYTAILRFKSDGIPAWIDPTINEFDLDFNQTPGNFMFPWTFPRIFAQSGFGSSPIITNDGDIDTPIHVELVGPLINPIIRNDTTDKSISLSGLTVLSGQVFVIDTDPFGYKIQVDGTDVWQYVVDGNMWSLIPGDNQLVFDIGGTTIDTIGSVQWYTRYLGQ